MLRTILLSSVLITLISAAASAHPGDVDPRLWPLIIDKYDTNGDGRIDTREYNAMYRDMQSESQGQIGFLTTTRSELIAWLRSLGYSLAEARVIADEILEDYDTNGNGVLENSEWYKFWKDMRNRNQSQFVGGNPVPVNPAGPAAPAALGPGLSGLF